MTSRNCSKYHPALGLFGATLKRQMGITFLVTAFLFLICPGFLWRDVAEGVYGTLRLRQDIVVWVLPIFLIALLLGIILLCFNHSHLFSRKSADLYYALAVKRDTLLAIRAGASFVGAVFAMTVSFSGLAMVNFLPDVTGVSLGELLKLYSLCLMGLLLCMSTVLIFIVNSGSIFHFVFSLLVVCGGIPLLCLVAAGWYESASYGIHTSEIWLRYSSPFAYAVYCLAAQEEFLHDGQVVIESSMVLVCLCQTLFLTAISFLMNHRRKAENSDSSFAFKAMPVLITVIASALGGYLVGIILMNSGNYYGADFWISFTLGACLVAIAAGAIISKGFRRIWRWFVCAGAATAVLFSMFLISDHLGQRNSRYVPEAEEVEYVVVEGNYQAPTVTVKENVELVTELHAYLLGTHYGDYEYISEVASSNYESDYVEATVAEEALTVTTYFYTHGYSDLLNGDFEITYYLKNGKQVQRSYWISSREGYALLLELVQTREYAEAWPDDLSTTEGEPVFMNYTGWAENDYDAALLNVEETKELLSLYGKELQTATQADLWSEQMVVVDLQANNFLTLVIPPSFEKTLAWVQEHLD